MPDEVIAILEVLKGAKDLAERQKLQAQTAIALMFFAGLRPGEARGATWENYDGKTLSVKQSVWRKHTTDPKTASAAKPVPVIEPLRQLLSELHAAESNPGSGPILRDVKGKPLSLDMLARVVIRPALRNRVNYRDGHSKDWKPLEWARLLFASSWYRNTAKHDHPQSNGCERTVAALQRQHNPYALHQIRE